MNNTKSQSEIETRTTRIDIATFPWVKDEVRRLAEEEGRSVSSYVERIIIAHLKQWEKDPD